MSRLIEFTSHNGEVLRGILDEADSDQAIMFVHGFERTTIESKFKHIVDVMKGKLNFFRFDFSGCGLSDGSFEDVTVEKLSQELADAIDVFKKECPQVQRISFIGFSLGCCVITRYLSDNKMKANRLVFFAPGLNQKQLLRYFFTRQQHRDMIITWDNFNTFFDENSFQADVMRSKRMMKEHEVSSAYFMENAEEDYQDDFLLLGRDPNTVMILQGDADNKVPSASNVKVYQKYPPILVRGGDHDLQRSDMVEQYLDRLTEFLKE